MLSEHQEEDYTIQLEECKNLSFVQNYRPLLDQENNAMIKYIQKHLEKSFICSSSSAAAAPVLLVKKPGRGLRFCVDYHALNAVTIKNWYPILLINNTFGKLAYAVYFTKLNIIAAFNRMRIKKKLEWMTVFNTKYSQFEYFVMLFSLCKYQKSFKVTLITPCMNI